MNEDYLQHHGIRGMRWGVRRNRPEGVSRKTNREAKRDAKKYTKAKMFYGEGAGIQRRHIYGSVRKKSKSPEYKKAFDYHVERTNLDKRAQQARAKRRRIDTAKTTARVTRQTYNAAVGNFARASAATAGAVLTYKVLREANLIPPARDIYNAAYYKGYTLYNELKSKGIIK